MIMTDPYIRWAVVVRVVDGDTIEVDLDLGFRIWFRETVRLAGIDAPEMRGPTKTAGLAAKAYLESLLPPGADVSIQTYKVRSATEKFGRYLACVLLNGIDVSAQMIEAGHGRAYNGGPRAA